MRGTIRVDLGASQTLPMTLRIISGAEDPTGMNTEMVDLLTGKAPTDLAPRYVEFALAGKNAAALGARIETQDGPGTFMIQVS